MNFVVYRYWALYKRDLTTLHKETIKHIWSQKEDFEASKSSPSVNVFTEIFKIRQQKDFDAIFVHILLNDI